MNAAVSIFSESDGQAQSYLTDGEYTATQDGFVLTYKLGGDDNSLVFNGKGIRQSRSGKFTYSAEFIAGKRCSFILYEMGYTFSQEVDVLCADAVSDNNYCMLKIIYCDCVNRDCITKINIKVTYKNH